MAAKTAAQLVIEVTTSAEAATKGMAEVSSAVADAGDTAERSSRQIGISADAADELGGKAGKATGALGALSSGFELMGPSGAKYAAGLQTAALATDFMSGVGDTLNLVMESTIVKNVRARAAALAHGAVTAALAVKTGVMTAAQWALNAAMSANPIGLVVLAIAALVAGLVLAYNKSATVRAIVQDVGRVGKQAVGWVVDKVADLVAAFKDNLPGALEAVKTAFTVATDVLLAPWKAVLKAVQSVIDLIKKIKLPHINVPGLRIVSSSSGAGGSSGIPPVVVQETGPRYDIRITVEGALDPVGVATQIGQLLNRYGIATGSA
jgi:hypothetical protein